MLKSLKVDEKAWESAKKRAFEQRVTMQEFVNALIMGTKKKRGKK